MVEVEESLWQEIIDVVVVYIVSCMPNIAKWSMFPLGMHKHFTIQLQFLRCATVCFLIFWIYLIY